MHSNPIIITFCSLLYYKDLDQHVRIHRIEKMLIPFDDSLKKYYIIRPAKFIQKPLDQYEIHPILTKLNYSPKKLNYNKTIVNRWHLYVRLSVNIELTIYRKNKIRNKYDEIDYKDQKLTTAFIIKKLKDNALFKRVSKDKMDKIVNNNLEIETRF